MTIRKILVLLGLGAVLLGGPAVSTAAPLDAPAIHALVDLNAQCLLGGAAGGRWLQPAAVAPALHNGDVYRLYGLAGSLGRTTGRAPASQGAPCPETLHVDLTRVPAAAAIAIGGVTAAAPRLARSENPNQAVYRQAVATVLQAHGLAHPQVEIQQILRVDLEGDGVPEVLISATHFAAGVAPRVAAGDYSVVLLRKVIRGRVQTFILEGEYYPQAAAFAAPPAHAITAVLDANGDGVLDVVVYSHYYEGEWSTVYEVKGDQVHDVLTCGCGA